MTHFDEPNIPQQEVSTFHFRPVYGWKQLEGYNVLLMLLETEIRLDWPASLTT